MTSTRSETGQPVLLDLFCKAGGCTKGYQRAGFYVVGVDHEPQANYCGEEFFQADALTFALEGYDAIHASPPCHANSTLAHMWNAGTYVDVIPEVRERLQAAGVPYVIENVMGAALRNPIKLCGSSFGLGVDGRQLRRHRLFESNVSIIALPCHHSGPVIGVYGTGGGGQMTRGFKARGAAEAGAALGTPWMTLAECAQAIPPAFTEHIGGYLMAALTARAAA